MITDLVKARREFKQQRCSAKQRGIGWNLTFHQWCKIWDDSGKYMQRGIRRGQYVMQRHLDRGDYATGNVEIGTIQQNIETRMQVKGFRRVTQSGSKPKIPNITDSVRPVDEVLIDIEDVPTPEVRITTEMREAGGKVILERLGGAFTAADLAVEVYAAMMRATITQNVGNG